MKKLVGVTLRFEESLPSLPVPPLRLTCNKYLESVKPCVSNKQFLITKAKVEEFCRGVGPVLQKKLEERASLKKNWLETWWEEYAYMKPRYPIAPTINIAGPVMLCEDIWPAEYGTQITRAAIALHFFMKEWKLLYSQERPVDCKGDIPYSMHQYYHLLSWCRIPGHTMDSYVTALQPAPAPTARYVSVITKGRIYECVVLNAQLDPISIPEMERQLHHIVEDASKKPTGPGLGSLTSENRTVWAQERERLLACNPRHEAMLDVIQRSILTLVLDDDNPSSMDEFQAFLLGGDCHNRWFDKSLQVIVFKNGLLGCNLDHLSCDAIVEIVTSYRALDAIKEYWGKRQQENISQKSSGNIPIPTELEFKLDHRFVESIKTATKQFQMLNDNVAIRALAWKVYGKKFIKQFGIHPDTFVQMVIQLADYKLHKRIAPTYETATTRKFYHGRTDTVRTLTTEAQNWCRVMESSQATAATKVKLLRIACTKHDELMMEAQNGLGIDRHLLGLKIIAEQSGLPIPDIYTDIAWTKSGGDGNFTLSTSLIGYRLVYGATPPMVEDGYGSFYSIQDDRVDLAATAFRSSKVTDCDRYVESLKQSFLDMQSILVESKL